MDDEREEGQGDQAGSRTNTGSDAQLVEHSADELDGLNRDVLNAEITQLEGKRDHTHVIARHLIDSLPLLQRSWDG